MITSFEERIEELQAFKEEHGHVRVIVKHDKSLYGFCGNTERFSLKIESRHWMSWASNGRSRTIRSMNV
jgi:hypothetical protein